MTGVRRALVVGVDTYDDPAFTALRSPARDAEALAEVLADPEIGDFAVTRSYNPTERELAEAIEAFYGEADRDDLLLLHLSCHGVKDAGGELFFAATDTKLKRLRATGVPSAFVNAVMADSRARRSVLLLDCCYSGAFERGMTHRSSHEVDLQDRFSGGGTGRGRAVITASSAMEYAFEAGDLADDAASGPSVFTSALVEGLRTGEADRDHDGRVDLDELYEYTLDRVRSATTRQTPHMWVYGLEGRLPVARRKTPVTTPAPLPREVQEAIDNPLAMVRSSVVPHLADLARGSHLGLALSAREALERLAADDSRQVEAAAARALGELPSGTTPVWPPPDPAASRPGPAGGREGGRPSRDPAPRRKPALDQDSDPSPRPAPSRRVVLAAVGGVLLVAALVALIGSQLGDGTPPGGTSGQSASTGPSPSTTSSPSPTAVGLPPLQWVGAAAPEPHEQVILDEVRRSFADTGSCRDESGPDPRDVVPSEVDNVVCSYPDDTAVVFSRFPSDAAQVEFFDLRLVGRELVERQGALGPEPRWHVDLPASRPGRAYGNVNTNARLDPVRAEIGWIVEGTQIYAYSFRPGDDFAGLYAWWSTTFLPPTAS